MDDSFDLFGGLPTVGGGGGGGGPTKNSAKATEDTTTTNISTKDSNDQPDIKPTAADDIAKPKALADKSKESTSSLVSSIGTSGTKLVS